MTLIQDKYLEMGGAAGPLGDPVHPEVGLPDGVGSFQEFIRGSIYWSPNTGAHEIHGAVHAKWNELGRELGFLGFPVTDETLAGDGFGHFNHFQNGSIY